MIIMKFGGTSVESAERIINTAEIIKANIEKNPVVIVSAVGGITNKLIELCNNPLKNRTILENIKNIHHEILEKLGLNKSLLYHNIEELSKIINKLDGKIDNKILDCVQSFGEQMSSKIIAAQLNKIGVDAQAFNSWDLGLLTNSDFGNSEPLEESFNVLKSNIIKLSIVPVITGFIGKTKNGEITTLGRGGSDYSAGIIGSAIDASEIQIWTDVNGIMSTDPKIVCNAKTLENVSFAEASELAYFGAKVLHPKTILPAVKKNIPVKVLNSFNPQDKGTTILENTTQSEQIVKAIAFKKNITLIHVDSKRMLGAYGFLAKLFDIFYKYKKSIDVISTSEVSVSLSIDNNSNLDDIVLELGKIADVKLFKNKSIICLVGEGIGYTAGILGKTFGIIGEEGINVEMVSYGASGINITFIVDEKDADSTVKALHKEYFRL